MSFTNLPVVIEGEINRTILQLAAAPQEQKKELIEKKEKLKGLIFDYLKLEKQYKEIAGLNKIY